VDGKEGNISSHHTNISSDLLELVLERGDLGTNFELLHNLTKAGVVTDHNTNHLAFTLGDRGTGHEDGGGEVVLARDFGDGGLVDVGLFLVLDSHTLLLALLLDFIGFTGHGRLVTKQLGALEEQTINWDVHTVVDLDDVSNVQVVVVENDHLSVTENVTL